MKRRAFKVTLLMDKGERVRFMTDSIKSALTAYYSTRNVKVTYMTPNKKWWEFWK